MGEEEEKYGVLFGETPEEDEEDEEEEREESTQKWGHFRCW
jgi:hypothetical protein